MNNIIIVNTKEKTPTLSFIKNFDEVIFSTNAFIGKNGTTENKKEGDLKTPLRNV